MISRSVLLCLLTICSLSINALALDTDGDGFSDQFEAGAGTDPNLFSSSPSGGQSVFPSPISLVSNLGVELNFAATGQDKLTCQFTLFGSTTASLAATNLSISVGGVVAVFPPLQNNKAATTDATIELKDSPLAGVEFTFRAQGALAQLLNDEGLTNSAITNQLRSIDIEVFFVSAGTNQLFKITKTDTYNATAGGTGTFHVLLEGAIKPLKPALSSFLATPNPASAGAPVTFTASAALKGDDISVTINFGDGTPPLTLSGASALASLKSGVSRTYATIGAYEAKLTVSSSTQSESASVFVLVGKATQVNPVNGMSSTVTKQPGAVSLSIDTSKVDGATTISTEFTESLGREVIAGAFPTRNVSVSGILVARSIASDGAGVEKARVRKTIAVGSRIAQESGANDEPADDTLTVSKISGGFTFDGSKTDKVSFNAGVLFPATFKPEVKGAAEGVLIHVAVGNVVDSIRVDAKGKPLGESTKGLLKKFKISFPKTADKPAKISGSLELTNASAAGFDTDGIQPNVRATETNISKKGVSRSIQIALVIDGIAYETLSPVLFQLGKDSATGKIQGRRAN